MECSKILPIINGSKFKHISWLGGRQHFVNQGITDLIQPVVWGTQPRISDKELRNMEKSKTMYELRSWHVVGWFTDYIIKKNYF